MYCTCNATLRRVRVTIAAVENQYALKILSACLCFCLSYPARKSYLVWVVYCHLWFVWLYHIFHIILLTARFSEKKVTEHQACVLTLAKINVWNIFSFWEELMYISLHIKYPLFSSDFNQNGIFSTDLQKSSNIKLHENPPSRSRDVPCEKTCMKRIIAVFSQFANASKNQWINALRGSKRCLLVLKIIQNTHQWTLWQEHRTLKCYTWIHEVTTVIYNAKRQYEWHRLFIVFRGSGRNAGENTGKIKFVKFTVAKI
jgi:hypothetical protein